MVKNTNNDAHCCARVTMREWSSISFPPLYPTSSLARVQFPIIYLFPLWGSIQSIFTKYRTLIIYLSFYVWPRSKWNRVSLFVAFISAQQHSQKMEMKFYLLQEVFGHFFQSSQKYQTKRCRPNMPSQMSSLVLDID